MSGVRLDLGLERLNGRIILQRSTFAFFGPDRGTGNIRCFHHFSVIFAKMLSILRGWIMVQ